MTPRHIAPSPRTRQRGVSVILMIAVLVLLGGIMVYAVGLVTSAQSGYSREIASGRAEAAAQAGLDWGRFRASIPALPVCAAAQSINTLPGTLAGYTVTVRCTASGPYSEGGTPVTHYRLVATACNRPQAGQCPNATASADYVERTLSGFVMR